MRVIDPAQTVIDLSLARERRDKGMASSLEHAESDSPGWSKRAFRMLVQYVSDHNHAFTIEHFRLWAYAHGLEKPDEERAFGGITAKAIRTGVIVKVGYAPAESSNGAVRATYAKPVASRPISQTAA